MAALQELYYVTLSLINKDIEKQCLIGMHTLPSLVPELGDELLIALTQSRLLICSDQSAAVQEELG